MTVLTVRILERIEDVDAAAWDRLGDDPLSSYGVLRALERARLPGVRLWYALVAGADGRPVAAAPLCRVEVDARPLARGALHALIGGVRRWRPRFLHTAIMVCGTPLSIANPPIRHAPAADRVAVLRALASSLDALGDAHDAPWRAFKELAAGDVATTARALGGPEGGWLLAPSEPSCTLAVEWPTFEAYLASLRSPYRRRLRVAERRLVAERVDVEVVPLAGAWDATLHALYEAVFERASVRFERLTPAFFVELGACAGCATSLIRFRRGRRVVGWVVLLLAGDTAYDLFHGIDYAANGPAALYVNQLTAVMRFAIASGARRVSLGQSTYDAKARFGATADERWIALRHRSRAVTAALTRARAALFPVRPVPRRRPFRAPRPACPAPAVSRP